MAGQTSVLIPSDINTTVKGKNNAMQGIFLLLCKETGTTFTFTGFQLSRLGVSGED